MSEYELYYWPGIPGRGEFVRLALEDAGADYTDVARVPGTGVKTMLRFMRSASPEPYAPPFLRHGDLVISQTALILQYLAPRLGLVPDDLGSRLRAHELAMTIADFVAEVHDVHHPIAVSLYYEDQKNEALRRAPHFLKERVPKYLGWLERQIERDGHLVPPGFSYVDLELFQVIEGMRYAFPKSMARFEPSVPRLVEVHDRVRERPRIAAYLASPRRIAFNKDGIFRHYPELDVAP